jgi:hypothetical protein
MGEYADDEIDRWIGDCNWGSRRRRDFVPRPIKLKNSHVFSRFARDGVNFKTGDRVRHKASGSVGEVIATRGTQICWRPDSRLKPRGIWVDSSALNFDI